MERSDQAVSLCKMHLSRNPHLQVAHSSRFSSRPKHRANRSVQTTGLPVSGSLPRDQRAARSPTNAGGHRTVVFETHAARTGVDPRSGVDALWRGDGEFVTLASRGTLRAAVEFSVDATESRMPAVGASPAK